MYKLRPIQVEIQLNGFHSVYYFEHGKHFTHTPEQHGFWEMVYVDRGNIVALADNIGYPMQEGQAIFHEPGEVHAHVSDNREANNMLVIAFSAEGAQLSFFRKKIFTLDATAKKLLSLFISEAKNALGVLPNRYDDKSDLDFSKEKFAATQMMQCYFCEFLIHLIRGGSAQSDTLTPSAEAHTIAQTSLAELIEKYLKENLYVPLALQDVCDHFLLGKSQLCAIYKQHTGKSLMAHYADLKMQEAKKLLREERLGVGEIAESLGFSGIHIFSRAFKKATGFSPTAYKKSVLFDVK